MIYVFVASNEFVMYADDTAVVHVSDDLDELVGKVGRLVLFQ